VKDWKNILMKKVKELNMRLNFIAFLISLIIFGAFNQEA